MRIKNIIKDLKYKIKMNIKMEILMVLKKYSNNKKKQMKIK